MTSTERQSKAKISTETLLRISVLVFWFMLGVQAFGTPMPEGEAGKSVISWFFAVTGFLGFGIAFWWNTRNIAFQVVGWRPILLLAFQAACGFTISTDLLYIVAAEIPLVLPARAASVWIVVQTLLLTAWIFWLDQTGKGHLSFMMLPQLPHLMVVLLTDVEVFAVHAFAFFMGYLAASETRGRRDAERLNAELLATQNLLAQSSRLAERAFVARELHDALGHHLVALKVNLELAQHLVVEGSAKMPISDALSLVKRLLSEVRGVISNVRSQPRMELRQAVQTLFTGVTEIAVELVFPRDTHIADPAHAHVLFRCVQEAITNTLKHARASRLWVEFSNDHQSITLVIRDDGRYASFGYGAWLERYAQALGVRRRHSGYCPCNRLWFYTDRPYTSIRKATTMIRVVIVDDHTLMRSGIRGLLALTEDISVVAEAGDGEKAIKVITETKPDLVLLDVRLPKLSGLKVLEMLGSQGELPPIILLTTFDDDAVLLQGMQAGAKGFLLKDVSLERLVSAIRRVMAGESCFRPALTERALDGMKNIPLDFQSLDLPSTLTRREIEVLALMAGGYNNLEIAEALGTTEGTIKNHVSNILSKLGVRDRVQAVFKGLEVGLL